LALLGRLSWERVSGFVMQASEKPAQLLTFAGSQRKGRNEPVDDVRSELPTGDIDPIPAFNPSPMHQESSAGRRQTYQYGALDGAAGRCWLGAPVTVDVAESARAGCVTLLTVTPPAKARQAAVTVNTSITDL